MKFLTLTLLAAAMLGGCSPDAGPVEKRSASPPLATAERWLAGGNLDQAEAAYRSILREKPSSSRAAAGLCRTLLLRGNVAEASQWGETALSTNPNLPETWSDLGKARLLSGNAQEAAEAFGQAAALDPANPAPRVDLGVALARLDRLNDAVAAFQAALSLDSRLPEAYYNLGRAWAGLGRPEESRDALERAISLRPDYSRAHLALGEALESAGDIAGAVEEYHRAAGGGAETDEAWLRAANLLLAQDRAGEAEQVLRRLVEVSPGHPEALEKLGILRLSRNDWTGAIGYLEGAAAASLGNARRHDLLGQAYEGGGQIGKAQRAYSYAIRIAPGEADYHFHLGRLQLGEKKWHRALEALEQAERLRPDDPEILLLLGRARFKEENLPGARKAYQRIIQVAPGTKLAERAEIALKELRGIYPNEEKTGSAEPFHKLIMREIVPTRTAPPSPPQEVNP